MNHASEHDIDRVLTALRDTEPSAGMESRILHALEARTPTRSTWFRWTSPMPWSLAALATAAVVFAVALTAHNTRRPAPSIAQSPVLTPSQNPVISTEAQHSPFVISTGATRSGEIAAFTEASAPHTFAQLRSTPTQPTYTPHELLCDCDPLAMAEMQAPSHPAPEMPLTAQERLLQRVSRRGDSVEIAELEPLANVPLQSAASTGEDAALQRVVQGYLKQLAAAETLNPTPSTSDSGNPIPDPGLTNPN